MATDDSSISTGIDENTSSLCFERQTRLYDEVFASSGNTWEQETLGIKRLLPDWLIAQQFFGLNWRYHDLKWHLLEEMRCF